MQRSVYASHSRAAEPASSTAPPHWIAAVDERSTWQRVVDANKCADPLGLSCAATPEHHRAKRPIGYARRANVVARGVGAAVTPNRAGKVADSVTYLGRHCRMVAAGGLAGAAARTASAPLDRIKLLFQVQVRLTPPPTPTLPFAPHHKGRCGCGCGCLWEDVDDMGYGACDAGGE